MASPAPALVTLKRQLLAAYPAMGSANIGIMGDTSHQARVSDHNDGNAIDIPVEGGPGAGAEHLMLCLALLDDPRAHYLIYDRVFYHKGRAPEAYTGTSPHTAHAHLSIDPAKRAEAQEWAFGKEEDVREVIIARGPAPGMNRVYQLIDPLTNDYAYGSVVEDLTGLANAGYEWQGEAFDLSLTDPTCTTALHRMTRGGFHKLVLAPNVSAMVGVGWADEGPVGRVSGTSGNRVYEWVKDECQYLTLNVDANTGGWTLVGSPFRTGVPAVDPHPSDANEQIATLETALTLVAMKAHELLALIPK